MARDDVPRSGEVTVDQSEILRVPQRLGRPPVTARAGGAVGRRRLTEPAAVPTPTAADTLIPDRPWIPASAPPAGLPGGLHPAGGGSSMPGSATRRSLKALSL